MENYPRPYQFLNGRLCVSAKFQPTSTNLFLLFSRDRLVNQHWPRLRKCVESLTDEQIWWRPNPSSNSIGNLVLHLNGNVRQWLVDSFSKKEDQRDRPAEFAATGEISGSDLLAKLGGTIHEGEQVINRLTEADLIASYEIQGYNVHGLDAVYQVVEHFGLHCGQIAYITKMLKDQDLGFYKELSKTGRHSA
jgi:hypothetical protein